MVLPELSQLSDLKMDYISLFLNTKPDEALFIDDRIENIRGAESLGIQTILFESSEQLKEKLAQFVLKIG